MTRPQRFLVRMILFLTVAGGFIAFLYEPLLNAFMANPAINGLITGILLLGIIYNFRQVVRLNPEVDWIESFRQNRPPQGSPPQLLAPMATMMGESGNRLRLSALSMRSVLDGIASRLDESRDISRYTIGLLIFLGLLGTFWGLLDTVSSVSSVIGGLQINGGEISDIFQKLKSGLEQPLDGMGTAFSSSLFGLSGSLLLGFLDLQAGQAQNRFFNELEDWLSSVTRLSSGAISPEGESVPAYVQALLEQTADSLENLQRTLTRGEESRIAVNNNLRQMGEQMATLTDHMRTEQMLMKSMASSQSDLHEYLRKIADAPRGGGEGIDDTTKAHIRSIDHQISRLVDEIANGRNEVLNGVRSEIKLLARTIAALADETDER
ncbi:MAG: flagellar motor protein MotA [Rhodospirillales bacterium]